MEDMWPLIADTLLAGGDFRLFTRGTSMRPLLREGRDSVLLESVTTPAVGDILLYRRQEGQFVLHRLVNVTKTGLSFLGDGQRTLEEGVPAECVLARVKGIYRDERYYPIDCFVMEAYGFCLPVMRPARHALSLTKQKLRKLLKK